MPYKDPHDPRLLAARRKHYYANKGQYKNRNQKSRAEAKQYILELKNTTPCSDCGIIYKDEPWLTDFDHLPEFEKVKNISVLVNTYGLAKRLMDELDKCELVCLICHRRRTAKRGGWVDNRLAHLLQ